MNFRFFAVIITFLLLASVTETHAENWPNWRGPNGDGTSSEINLPTKWDSVTNVLWKVQLPGVGHASPIVWADRLFTVTAKPETQEKILLCYDIKKGDLVWQATVLNTPWKINTMITVLHQALLPPTANIFMYRFLTAQSGSCCL